MFFREVLDSDREDQAGIVSVVDPPGLARQRFTSESALSLASSGGSHIQCGGRAGWDTNDSRITSSSFFRLNPSAW